MENASSTFDILPAQADKNTYETHESTINFVNSHTGPLSASDDYYLGTYQDYSKEQAMNPHHLEQHSTPHAGLGLSYQKFREQYDMGIYQSHVISPATDGFTSAPAAFGAYQGSPNGGDYPRNHFPPTDYGQSGFEGYFYNPQQHQYSGAESADPWMSNTSAGYQNDASIMEFMDAEKNYYLRNSMHVDPTTLDGISGGFHSNFLHESGQTITSGSNCHTPQMQKHKDDLKKTSRSAGQPTNIVPNGKMDRKTLKRLRNRVSASRCRTKKKEWINEMEDESNAINHENRLLMKKISALEESILNMKTSLGQN